MPQIDRLLDLRHSSKLEQIEVALNAVGYRIELSVLAATRRPQARLDGKRGRDWRHWHARMSACNPITSRPNSPR